MWQFYLFALLIFAHLSEARLQAIDSRYAVRLTQVIHRHGARSPLPKHNEKLICGLEYPCGHLNNVGISMLRALGTYVRDRYNDLKIVEEPFFPMKEYNSSLVYSRSTAKERTIRSSSAFLSGVLPESTLPVTYTVELDRDTLLNPDVYPSSLSRYLDTERQEALLNPIVDSHFTWNQVKQIAAEALITEDCQDYNKRYDCVLQLYDIAVCYKAINKLHDKPKLKKALKGARDVNMRYYSYLYSYDPNIELDRIQGPVAHKLAEEIVDNMYSHLSSPSYRMYEYSTHDTMLIPLAVMLGDDSDGTMNVPFAQTYIVELLQNLDTETYHVRVLRGFPQRNKTGKDGEFSFVQTHIEWHCMADNNSVYVPTGNICPLEDFVRYINSTKPATEDGFCTIGKDLYEKLRCPAAVTDKLPLSPLCRQYRIVCPGRACAQGFVLGAADLQCYPVATDPGPQTA